MTSASKAINTIINYLQQADTLPSPQLRKLGLIYSSYRLIVSIFYMLMFYVTVKTDSSFPLPSLLQQTTLIFYVLLSLILLVLFSVISKRPRRQLALGLALDVIILSLLLYTDGAPDLQLTMLYMVVVAASFMLLQGSHALIITLLAIIFVIYQQFFYAIANRMSLANLGDALLMSASFLIVGFLSWSISQRLVHVEKMAARQAKEVERLNTINQEVISQMLNGVIVIDKQRIVLANQATYQLLAISAMQASLSNMIPISEKDSISAIGQKERMTDQLSPYNDPFADFQRQLIEQHAALLTSCLAVPAGQSHTFIYKLPAAARASTIGKLRIQVIPLKDASQLIFLEDLRREQASAQQLKLASLGQLTASIAHEIRNPLAAISQASQLLMEDINAPIASGTDPDNATDPELKSIPTPENYELYNMIFAQTKRVNRIIEDVLKLSRQQQSNQQSIALAPWLSKFLDSYFRDHDVFLRLYAEPIIQFDTQQLEQVLINLINNGLRHSSYAHPHAYVEIEVHTAQNDVILDVLDDGSGVDTADLEHLFNPFFTTDKAGTGLGLYLSQAFCEANHAHLLYVPEHKKTCFRLIVPAIETALLIGK
ncbi:HAMP domain-containing sensor histidine kinase [Psychrobacter sp. CAL346-MNA-CIBAN-0220]|uniref:sensor histidine kinase n=1 Tax=Psychrobacter sp. CAL346-MNA-CIBAN-0220 TaxID=3140457 RepID=UPI00331BF94E